MTAVLDRACTWLPGAESSIRTARGWAAATLAAVTPPLPAPVIDDAVLIISELATNAVRHTRSGRGGTYALTLETDPDHVRIWVMDEGAAAIPFPRCADRDHDEEGGRGLAIIQACADESGPVVTATATGYTAAIHLTTPGTRSGGGRSCRR
ncbi:anti-sigma regulatory factor (Ser/Thr protein kinase) [Murinocardiopsis flavida]|uniref:Anti-sigma regulatory factor (Ser/Thr protein kinase) n=1 Tax=Murinocardiopsis flavida TaxID=645275 RepID=A0A2P8CZ72_9ACTN|nr:ATP-binding protein [Murinocardiopsis flavida]PSK90269.1 anti-sigma regulatory factor (Ser/Thr protein kinase) [Murinocardiopsis flavida]